MSHRPDVKPVLGSEPVAQATMYKDEEERKLMRAASRIDDACIDMAIHAIREGITEKELSSKVEHFFQEKGCDHLGFSIVAMGANGADPHHGTDGTVLKEGDSIVMDIGAPFNHYWCDMTRTVFYKSASEERAPFTRRFAAPTRQPSPSSSRASLLKRSTLPPARSLRTRATANTSPTAPATASA